MFDFKDNVPVTTEKRFHKRIEKHKEKGMSSYRHHFWWFVHNCIAHPIIGLLPVQWAFSFHDFTSKKIDTKL